MVRVFTHCVNQQTADAALLGKHRLFSYVMTKPNVTICEPDLHRLLKNN